MILASEPNKQARTRNKLSTEPRELGRCYKSSKPIDGLLNNNMTLLQYFDQCWKYSSSLSLPLVQSSFFWSVDSSSLSPSVDTFNLPCFLPAQNLRSGITWFRATSQSLVSTHLMRISKTWLTVRTLRVGKSARYVWIGKRAVRMLASLALFSHRFCHTMSIESHFRDGSSDHFVSVAIHYTTNNIRLISPELRQFLVGIGCEINNSFFGTSDWCFWFSL